MTDQISRIQYYESLLNEASAVLKQYDEALEAFVRVQKRISELDAYYASNEWKADFEASERSELPEDLLCGVLSEDGIDHVLDDNRELLARTGTIAEEIGQERTDCE
ncbi:MAG: DUF4298 domain-containing protein [Clostridia bacterium]|nr:DUF4298 domain-containing protein [Clostridia bacterium]